jgi:hypothetical protein
VKLQCHVEELSTIAIGDRPAVADRGSVEDRFCIRVRATT